MSDAFRMFAQGFAGVVSSQQSITVQTISGTGSLRVGANFLVNCFHTGKLRLVKVTYWPVILLGVVFALVTVSFPWSFT